MVVNANAVWEDLEMKEGEFFKKPRPSHIHFNCDYSQYNNNVF